MKKNVIALGFLFFIIPIYAQKKAVEKVKDTVQTEIVEVVTTYNPKIAGAKKITENPILQVFEKSEKKKLEYTIFSAPVASTFIPKSGVAKPIDVGVKERVYKNYFAAGYGNYGTSFIETYLHHSTRFENDFGFSANYITSEENIRNSKLNSGFSKVNTGLFYQQEEHYFNWKVSLNSERNQYNWYGLPSTIAFTPSTIGFINEKQTYTFFELLSEFNFKDSFLDYGKASVSYFTDAFKSKEILAKIDTKLNLPIAFIHTDLKDISLKSGIEFLKGQFANNYAGTNSVNYNLITAKLHPEYHIVYKNISFKLGLKTFLSLDVENEVTNFLGYPDIEIKTPILKEYLAIYAGYTGNLHTNSYQKFSEENPYISPTLFITQTSEKNNLFVGVNGNLTKEVSFHVKLSTKMEEDKPLFLLNNSKSDGSSATATTSILKGYEFGNSFDVFYDDVKTTTLLSELEYNFNKNISLGTLIEWNQFMVTNAITNWNIPTLKTAITANYKSDKWYGLTTVFYVNERKDALYSTIYPATINSTQNIGSFIDTNLEGGYHFNDRFSVFLKLNNLLNANYQVFANFDTQGFQALGGVSYKFDF